MTDARDETAEGCDPVPPWSWALVGCGLVVVFLETRPVPRDLDALRARLPDGFERATPPGLAHASPRELRALPGIGQTRALAIARSRFEDGPLTTAEELERIPGIGPATAERVRTALEP